MGSMSTVYTMGTFLSRAEGLGQEVRVLVEGHWITGTPLSCDGHGAILDSEQDGQVLVRVEAITAATYVRPESDIPRPRAQEDAWAHEGGFATATCLG